MKILVVNAGSSSLKYQLIDMDNKSVLAKGLCERIGIDGSNLQHTCVVKGLDKIKIEKPMKEPLIGDKLLQQPIFPSTIHHSLIPTLIL